MSGTEMLTIVLAQPEFPGGDAPGGQGEGFGKSTPVGLLLLLVLLIAVAFLVRSMSKHLRRLPNRFDQERATAAAPTRVRKAEAAKAEAEAAEEDAGENEDSRGDDAAEDEDSEEGSESGREPQPDGSTGRKAT